MTSLIKIREIPGGIHPPEHKAQSLRLPLGSVPLPVLEAQVRDWIRAATPAG